MGLQARTAWGGHRRGRTFIKLLLEIELFRRRRQLDDRAPCSPHGLIVPDLPVVAIVLAHRGPEPPDRLESHVGVGLATELAGNLRDILETSLTEHLQDLPVP